MALTERRENQILQTVTVRIDEGKKGPPDSYTEEEKAFYTALEKDILKSRDNGEVANFSIPSSYD